MASVVDALPRTADGRPTLAGAACLPPMNATASPREPAKQTRNSRQGRTNGAEPKQKTRDRFGLLNGFVDCSMADLSKAELATWLCLYRDTRNGTACTSQADIARRSGLSVRSVKYAVRRLLDSGLLVRVYCGGLNRGPSRYRVESLGQPASPVQGQKCVSDRGNQLHLSHKGP